MDIFIKLPRDTPEPAKSFKSFLPKSKIIMPTESIILNELRNVFILIKLN